MCNQYFHYKLWKQVEYKIERDLIISPEGKKDTNPKHETYKFSVTLRNDQMSYLWFSKAGSLIIQKEGA